MQPARRRLSASARAAREVGAFLPARDKRGPCGYGHAWYGISADTTEARLQEMEPCCDLLPGWQVEQAEEWDDAKYSPAGQEAIAEPLLVL